MKPRSPFIALIFTFLAGCATPSVVQLSPDTYMLSRNVGGQIAGGLARTKEEVIRQANEFAERQGKVAIPIASKESPANFYSLGTFEYQFRVVDRNDPEAKRTSLLPRAEVVVETIGKTTPDSKVMAASDLYTELTKLDDLRKRGIITEDEFAVQKKRLLEK